MRRVKRILLTVGLAAGALGYVWVAAVRAVPGIQARKRRARQRGR